LRCWTKSDTLVVVIFENLLLQIAMNRCPFFAVAVFSAVFFTVLPSFGVNYAVFVGVDNYSNSQKGDYQLENLSFCSADMLGLRDALVKAKFVTNLYRV